MNPTLTSVEGESLRAGVIQKLCREVPELSAMVRNWNEPPGGVFDAHAKDRRESVTAPAPEDASLPMLSCHRYGTAILGDGQRERELRLHVIDRSRINDSRCGRPAKTRFSISLWNPNATGSVDRLGYGR